MHLKKKKKMWPLRGLEAKMETQQLTKDLKVLGLCFKAGKLGIFIVLFY